MTINCYAHSNRFYVINNGLHPEVIEYIKYLGGRVDEDGDYFWDSDLDPLYYVIYKLSMEYQLLIK